MDYLGFTLDWEHQFEDNMPFYLQVSLDNDTVHLSEHHGDASPGGAIRIQMNNVKAYHASLAAKNYAYMRPGIEKTPWHTKEVTVTDPFNNRIIFYEEEQT